MREAVLALALVACSGSLQPPGNPSPDAAPACSGAFDPAFGTGGALTGGVLVADDRVPFMEPFAGVTQLDDKIVVVGSTDEPPSRFVVVRYLPDGTLDQTFSNDGVDVPALGNDTGAAARAVAVQADGKLLVAGIVDGQAALARWTTDGALDTSFAGGFVTLGAGRPLGVAVNGAGIVVAADGGGSRAILYRVDLGGALDASFGTNGVVTYTLDSSTPAGTTVSAFFLDPQGRHLLASAPNYAAGATVVRLTADGALDTTFGNGGGAWPPVRIEAVGGIATQASGRILLATSHTSAVFPMLDHGALDSGADDSSYGAGGMCWLPDGITAQAMVMDASGGVTVTGDSRSVLVAAHVTASGQYERCWTSAVKVGAARASVIDSQGRVTIVASAPVDSLRTRLALARLQ